MFASSYAYDALIFPNDTNLEGMLLLSNSHFATLHLGGVLSLFCRLFISGAFLYLLDVELPEFLAHLYWISSGLIGAPCCSICAYYFLYHIFCTDMHTFFASLICNIYVDLHNKRARLYPSMPLSLLYEIPHFPLML